jgi:hypothetical protein
LVPYRPFSRRATSPAPGNPEDENDVLDIRMEVSVLEVHLDTVV